MILKGEAHYINSCKRNVSSFDFNVGDKIDEVKKILETAKSQSNQTPSLENIGYIEGNLIKANYIIKDLLKVISLINLEEHIFDDKNNHIKIKEQ